MEEFNGGFCVECQRVFSGRPELGKATIASTYYTHHDDARSIETAANQGCRFCHIVWNSLTEKEQIQVRTQMPPLFSERGFVNYEEMEEASSPYPAKYYFKEDGRGYTMSYEIYTKGFKRGEWQNNGGIRRRFTLASSLDVQSLLPSLKTSPCTDLDSSMVLASQWLTQCNENHTDCQGKTSKSFLPTRLISVGEWDGTEFSEPRIYLTGTNVARPVPSYTTLSHCWGQLKIPRLLKDNIADFQTRIKFSDLPKTFQHAISITRKMQIRYIWIDSLCICQDDENDWLHESTKMADVYENSYCNISATAAKDGSVGCFFSRDEKLVRPLEINPSWINLKAGAYYVIDDGLWVREVDNAPLNTRAWVFQERFLSPLNLSFGANRMFWECQGLRASESFLGGLPKSMTSATFKVSDPTALGELYKPNAKKEERKPDDDAMRVWMMLVTGAQLPVTKGTEFSDKKELGAVPQAYRQWTHLITAYTAAKLTYESDLLIALYGVAQWMKRSLFKDTYLAGLWKNHIVNQLLWMTYKNLNKSYPEVYRAPSWSWASVNAEIAFRDIVQTDEKTALAEVLDVQVETMEGKEGKIRNGWLSIKGKLLPAKWEIDWAWSKRSEAPAEVGDGNPSLRTLSKNRTTEAEVSGWAKDPTNYMSFSVNGVKISNFTGFPDVSESCFEGKTFCLAIERRSPAENEPQKFRNLLYLIEGLVLVQAREQEGYRLVGWFLARGDGAEEYEKMLEARREEIVRIV